MQRLIDGYRRVRGLSWPAEYPIAQLPNPPAGGFSPGGHDSSVWSAQLPAEIAWMAPLLAG